MPAWPGEGTKLFQTVKGAAGQPKGSRVAGLPSASSPTKTKSPGPRGSRSSPNGAETGGCQSHRRRGPGEDDLRSVAGHVHLGRHSLGLVGEGRADGRWDGPNVKHYVATETS